MLRKRYIMLMLAMISIASHAQKTEREYLRSGNKQYNDSLYVDAEINYRKALDVNPESADAMYDLGNTLLMQEKGKEAIEQYENSARLEKDKSKLAEIYHNMGVILQMSKQYAECIEAYKESLRNNPHDDETRYNLALAQKMLKDQQQQQQNRDQNQQQKQEQQKDDQQQNKDQQDQQNKQQQQNQQQQNQDQMSKENAEQLLNAVMQDEKNVQDKVKKQIQLRGKKLEKDW